MPVWDAHCHGFDVGEVVQRPPDTFWDRLTLAGMFTSSAQRSPSSDGNAFRPKPNLDPLVRTAVRRLANVLGCEAVEAEVAATRLAALRKDPAGYLVRLWSDAGIAALLVDDGYPQPPIDGSHLARSISLPVHRVARIEPAISELMRTVQSWSELEEGFENWVECAAEGGAVAFKSVIAYRSGLDVRVWAPSEAQAGFAAWRAYEGLGEPPGAKVVRDTLLLRLLRSCKASGRPVHIHTGAGDPTVAFREAKPGLLFELLSQHRDQPIVLIHSGWPWLEEAAYLANAFPQVYLETSVTTPWSSVALDQRLEMLLGMSPAGKIMHGSDEATEPEVIWLAALLAKEAWERVLTNAVKHAWYTVDEAHSVATAIFAGNCRRLHGV